jgi:hypothetical protein
MKDLFTTTAEEKEVINQFVLDHNVGSISRNIDMDNVNLLVKNLCDSVRKSPEPADIVISSEMTPNGGNIKFYQIVKLESKSETDERRNYFDARSVDFVLIEPIGYPEIEPYNRQSPFYIGLSYSKLNKHQTDAFSVYTRILTEKPLCQVRASFDEFYYNDFWKSIRFGLAIEREKVGQFLFSFLKLMGFSEDVANVVDVFAEEVISTYISLEEIIKLK